MNRIVLDPITKGSPTEPTQLEISSDYLIHTQGKTSNFDIIGRYFKYEYYLSNQSTCLQNVRFG